MEFQDVLQEWLTNFVIFLPNLIAGIVIFILTLISSGFIAKWIRKVVKKRVSNQEILQLISRLTRWSVLIVGTILALDQVNFDVTGFIAGLGVAGFTIGFALQDIAKNFISGILLLYRQPFSIGERVMVSDYKGEVKEINVRDTVIETLDGELVIIPNREVYENPIINLTHIPIRRRTIVIGLGYEQDVEKAERLFLDAIKSTPEVETDPPPTIRADSLGDSALMLEALYWVDQKEHDFLQVHSKVVKAILHTAEENNINLPYPVQTVLLRHLSG
jgi:small conductance mechanosensitive channel